MDFATNSVVLCLRFNKNIRQNFESVDLSSNVVAFRDRVFRVLNLKGDEFELWHHGHHLRDNEKLEEYGIKSGSTVDVIKKPVSQQPEVEGIDSEKLKQMRRGVMTIRAHKTQRHILEKVFQSQEAMENLIAATPGLDSDSIAMGLVLDLDMFVLAATSDKETLGKIVASHPSFGHAALNLIATVSEEAARTQPDDSNTPTSREAYEINRPSDEENEDEEEMEFDEINPREDQATQGNIAGPAGVITTDFFRQAILAATSATVVTQAQLDQLRDMGITDEATARRALEQSGGNITLALEILFGDGMF